MLNHAASMLLRCGRRFKSGGVIINEHTLTAGGTRRHVETLARHFEFIHADELPSRLEQASKRPFCLLTFDDGKKSNATQSAPVLYQMGVPALLFVTTGFLDKRQPLWFDRYEALIAALGVEPPGLERETVKHLPLDLILERLDRHCTENGFLSPIGSDDLKPMSWEDVRHLQKIGFAIGAHGVRHSILTRERREVALAEIAESMSRVTAETGSPCRSFAFPNGNHTAELAQYAAECGASLVVTTDPAWVKRRDPLWRLPRIQLHEFDSVGKIMMKIVLAAVEGVLSNPDGTGRSYVSSRRMAGLCKF